MPRDYYAPIVEDAEPTSETIRRTAALLSWEVPLAQVRDNLLESGLTEYQVFLAVKAAELILKNRPEEPIEQAVCIKTVFNESPIG